MGAASDPARLRSIFDVTPCSAAKMSDWAILSPLAAAFHVASRLGRVCDWTMTVTQLAAVRAEITPRLVQVLEDADALSFQRRRGSLLDETAGGTA